MNKLQINPDMAELIGVYVEGGELSDLETNLVEQWINEGLVTDNLLSDISSLPDLEVKDSSFNDLFLPIGTTFLDFTTDNPLLDTDMNTSSIIGDVVPFPDLSSNSIMQQQSDTCAIKSQQIILHSFGIDIPEEILTIEATNKGYYVPGMGSNPMDVGNLLNDHGVNTHTKVNATIYDLVAELAQGHKVIVGVDADELWRPSYFNDLFGEQANHALVVTGIDTSNPNDIRVIITDPGTGDVARSYPMEQFLDAWHDSSCLMVATDDAPALSYPNGIYNHEMINFDYSAGHIPYIDHIPYDIFSDVMLPQIDDFFAHHLYDTDGLLHNGHTFEIMSHAFDSYDDIFTNEGDINGVDFSDMFNSLF